VLYGYVFLCAYVFEKINMLFAGLGPHSTVHFQIPIRLFFTMKKSLFALLAFASFLMPAFSQNSSLYGVFADKTDRSPLVGASVLLTAPGDSTQRRMAVTDTGGRFVFKGLLQQTYRLQAVYLSYRDWEQAVTLRDSALDLGVLLLEPDGELLKEVQVIEKMNTVAPKGDTTEFNAGAFKTNPDADAEDLIKKMPGITVENGVVKAQDMPVPAIRNVINRA